MRYISRCLDSILTQTLKEIEILVVDGNSTDGTTDIVKSYVYHDKRIRLIQQDPQKPGVMVAKREGYMAAAGQYIAFCDADDTMPIEALQILYNKAISQNADVVIGEIVYLLRTNEIACSCQSIKKNKVYIDSFLNKEIENRMTGKLYSRALLQKSGLPAIPRMALGEDWLFNYLLAGNIKSWCTLKNIVYSYYQHESSITYSSQTDDYADSWLYAMKLIWDKYGNNPKLKERIANDLSMACTQLLLRGLSFSALSAAANKYQMQWVMDPNKLRVSSQKKMS